MAGFGCPPRVLAEIKRFLQIEADNAEATSRSPHMEHEAKTAAVLRAAIADFQIGNYQKALTILEGYHSLRRVRADHQPDPEGSPAMDNTVANALNQWIELLRDRIQGDGLKN